MAQPAKPDQDLSDLAWKDQYARLIIRENLAKDIAKVNLADLAKTGLVDGDAPPNYDGFPQRKPAPTPFPDPGGFKVCIVGAGIAGLYTAYVLDQLKVPYDLIESSKRIGGRLRTHYFGKDDRPAAKDDKEREWAQKHHQYYDIGAMRFPNTPVMARTFDLFRRTNVKEIPYYLQGPGTATRYNDITKISNPSTKEVEEDPFRVSVKNGGSIPDITVKNPDVILNDAYDWYRMKIKRDPAVGFRYLFNHDKFSLRDYLAFVEGHDSQTIDWLETLNSATGWFGMGFVENIFESLDFDYGHDETPPGKDQDPASKKVDWTCIDGGTECLVENLYAMLQKSPFSAKPKIGLNDGPAEVNKSVTAVAIDDKIDGNNNVVVHIKDTANPSAEPEKRKYSTVISTTTFAAMQKMDLTGLDLSYAYKAAIRSLKYDTSSKVGMVFREPWWMDRGIVEGGVSKSDSPLRVCVYPSYNIKDPRTKPDTHEDECTNFVLLCSYTWGQDSERIASLINKNSPNDEAALKELLLRNLADLHTTTKEESNKLYRDLADWYVTHHAYDWSKDPDASGAFALFGPGDFQKMYSTITKPAANGKFHIVGEAASCRHAWIAGALDSAIRGIHHFLVRYGMQDKVVELQLEKTGEVDYEYDYLCVALGMLSKKQRPPLVSPVLSKFSAEVRGVVPPEGPHPIHLAV